MNRYAINKEYCGQPEPRFVVRFCGDWVGQSASRLDAVEMMKAHASDTRPQITAHRPPTMAEIKFGYGATHYRDFAHGEWLKDDGSYKTKLKADDGLWYSRR